MRWWRCSFCLRGGSLIRRRRRCRSLRMFNLCLLLRGILFYLIFDATCLLLCGDFHYPAFRQLPGFASRQLRRLVWISCNDVYFGAVAVNSVHVYSGIIFLVYTLGGVTLYTHAVYTFCALPGAILFPHQINKSSINALAQERCCSLDGRLAQRTI